MAYPTNPDQDKAHPKPINQRFNQTDIDPDRLGVTDEEFDRQSKKIDEALALRDPLTGINILDDALETDRERQVGSPDSLYHDE